MRIVQDRRWSAWLARFVARRAGGRFEHRYDTARKLDREFERIQHMTCASVRGVCWLAEVIEGMNIDSDEMIAVVVQETGDRAEAETPDRAIYAGKVIGREAADYLGAGANPTLRFMVGETHVRTLTLVELNAL